MSKIPKNLQGVLWSRNISNLDLQRDKNYIIHQILMYGTLKDISWLKQTYKKNHIKSIFINEPRKLYTESGFNLVKNYLLNISNQLNKVYYVKNLPRNIR